jgi:hypothetical protein
MINRLLNWFWIHRMRQACKFFWDYTPIFIEDKGKGSIYIFRRASGEQEGTEARAPWPRIIIALDNKPVCEFEYRTHFGGGGGYEITRMKRGEWLKRVWDFYLGEKRREKAEEEIKHKALFGPLDE